VNIYLSPELHAHRRGRFLTSLLATEAPIETLLPQSGLVLLTGEQFQTSPDQQTEYITWARQPGRTLLLLPPYKEGRIFAWLDWTIELSSAPFGAAASAPLERILSAEVGYRLHGIDGSNAASTHHCEHACHTRYWKAHSNSGVVAATTLPLWSISLLDHAEIATAFLIEIAGYAGKASSPTPANLQKPDTLLPQDNTVLVCCYGLGVTTASELAEGMRSNAIPLLRLEAFDLPKSIERLRRAELVDDQGITEAGLAFLKASKYWPFAENLKRESSSL